MPQLLSDLINGARASVVQVGTNAVGAGLAAPELGAPHLQRLAELGFLPGEPVQVLRRGPGGREPLVVLIGNTMLALRLAEARCVEVALA